MKILRFIALAFGLLACSPALAQWQVPQYNVPVGMGSGVKGFAWAAPGAQYNALLSNGAGAYPSFQALVSTMLSDSGNLARLTANTFTGNQTFNGGTETFNGVNNFVGNVNAGGQVNTTGTNNFAGSNFVPGPTYFGNGKPWADVRSGANGCAQAAGNGSNDDTAAIQCQVTYMYNTYAGGTVFVPCGQYLVSGAGIKVYSGVWLVGSSQYCSYIETNTNITPVSFVHDPTNNTSCPVGNHYGGMEKLQVSGYNNSGATAPATWITQNCNVDINDTLSFLGSYGLQNDGVDSVIKGGWVSGYTGAVFSRGANWYVRVKMDKFAGSPTYGFNMGTPLFSGFAENHLMQVDLTCTCTYSLYINDGSGTQSVLFITDSVLDSPIDQVAGKVLAFTGNEVGSTSFVVNDGVFMMATSIALGGSTTLSGTAARTCAASSAFTC